jgi:hypothetical protein
VEEYRVIIPDDDFRIVEFRQENLPGIAVLNSALIDFEPKIVFAWHLSLMLQCEDLILNGMPSKAERDVIDPFGDALDAIFKGDDSDKPNSLFLARITWNESRELIYRVFNPEPANEYLQKLIASHDYPRPFDFRIDHDPEWNLAAWHLTAGTQPG